MGTDTVLDFDTDMQTIRDYVNAVVDIKARIVAAYCAALDQLQLVLQTASAAEARPDILGVVMKSGLKAVEKLAVGAVKDATTVDLAPLVDLLHGIADEVDRAAKAGVNRTAASWILDLRNKIVNTYTQGQTGDALRAQLEDEYKQADEGGRGGYIAGVEIELEALRTQALVPRAEKIELGMYESWINQNFDGDCMDGAGMIELQFDADRNAVSARIIAPLGGRVAGRLNDIMQVAGVANVMDLKVVKKVCVEFACMCFEDDNRVRKETLDDEVSAFLSSPSNWQQFTALST